MEPFLRRLVRRLLPGRASNARDVRSMLQPAERDHLFDLARTHYTGQGAIVDLGTWLGGSTAALAAGLEANTHPAAQGRTVHAFDLFELNAYLKRTYTYPELAAIPVGGSFLPVFERNLHPWRKRVSVHAGDLSSYTWTQGKVELVHVDIMKSWALTRAVLRNFFPQLIPGVSLVLHQDFVHYNTVWIHLVMYRIREHFEPMLHVPGTTTYQFRLRSAVPGALLDHPYSASDFTPEEAAAAFAWSRSLITDPFMRFNIDAAEAMFHVHNGDRARAEVVLGPALAAESAYKVKHPAERRRSELAQVEERLALLPE